MKTILLMEDDTNLNKGISLKLKKEGYQVLSAFCIKEAEIFLKSNSVDLIISDIMLPDGNGMEFCRKIREKSKIYLIYLTALDQEIDIISGYDSGADDYVTKPFLLLVLLSKVNVLMRRLEDKGGEILCTGELELHYKESKVMKQETIIPLSKTEYQLLLLLLENAKQIMTKEQILERIWDIDSQFVDENTVAVNVSRLKNKLGTNAISNIRGVGYIWTETVTKK